MEDKEIFKEIDVELGIKGLAKDQDWEEVVKEVEKNFKSSIGIPQIMDQKDVATHHLEEAKEAEIFNKLDWRAKEAEED